MCTEELVTTARLELSGKGHNQSEIQSWNRGTRIRPGRRLIQAPKRQMWQ